MRVETYFAGALFLLGRYIVNGDIADDRKKGMANF